jgi:hypothetical protein
VGRIRASASQILVLSTKIYSQRGSAYTLKCTRSLAVGAWRVPRGAKQNRHMNIIILWVSKCSSCARRPQCVSLNFFLPRPMCFCQRWKFVVYSIHEWIMRGEQNDYSLHIWHREWIIMPREAIQNSSRKLSSKSLRGAHVIIFLGEQMLISSSLLLRACLEELLEECVFHMYFKGILIWRCVY